MMKWTDNSIETVLCGSSSRNSPTFGDWEATALDIAYDSVDYVSLHQYYGNQADDTPSFLAKTLELEEFIYSVICTCDYVKAKSVQRKQSIFHLTNGMFGITATMLRMSVGVMLRRVLRIFIISKMHFL